MTQKQQLEISLETASCKRSVRRVRPIRPTRARWWFEQMHRIVDAAPDPARAGRQGQPGALPAPERKAA